MDRAQRIDENNGVPCLVIIFTPRNMNINCKKWINFVFSDDEIKN